MFDSGGISGNPWDHHQQREADDGGCGEPTPALLELQAAWAHLQVLPQKGLTKYCSYHSCCSYYNNTSHHSHHQQRNQSSGKRSGSCPIQENRRRMDRSDWKKKNPPKAENKSTTSSLVKKQKNKTEPTSTSASIPVFIPTSVTAPIPANITEHPVLPAPKAAARKKSKIKAVSTIIETSETNMETTTNLKRRRNSGEGAAKKMCSGLSYTEDPLEGPSNAYPPKQP